MQMRRYWMYPVLTLMMIVGLLLAITPLMAQSSDTVITLGIQEWQQDVYNDELFDDFEAANPGVNVVIEVMGQEASFFGSPLFDMEGYLETLSAYAESADVLPVNSYQLSPIATRGGFFLDMMPLVATDPELEEGDFYPAMLETFQWDGGMWALPISGNLNLIIYDRNAFDEAGIPYPDDTWTLSDFITASDALTTYNEDGSIDVPAMVGFDNAVLYRALLGTGLYDDSVIPNQPDLVKPELADLIEQWRTYDESRFGESGPNFSSIDFNAIPLAISGTWRLTNAAAGFGTNADQDLQGALLPGGVAGLNVNGLAISAGTQHPELAYDLIKYLTASVDVAGRNFGDTPARRSLVGVEPDSEMIFAPDIPEDVQALIDRGLENALPASEMRFFEYASMAGSGPDMPDDLMLALEEQQIELEETLAEMDALNQATVVEVATPAPTPVLSADEITLKFHVYEIFSPLPNRDEWDALLAAFVAEDPQVGFVELSTGFQNPNQEPDLDCYYRSMNSVPTTNLEALLPLDPFLAADAAFDESDLLPGLMDLVTRDGQVWALPFNVQPAVMWYNSETLEESGAFEPYSGWTITDFEDMLRQMATVTTDEPYSPQMGGNPYLLMLIAAYGGLPADYSTDPPTFNLTDETNLNAIRQALDLAKDGLINYQQLATFGGGGFGGDVALYSTYLSAIDFRLQQREADDPYRVATFPRGNDYVPVSLNVSGGYIDSRTMHPEACYRLLSKIAQTPSLSLAMPARQSQFTQSPLGDDLVQFYQDIAASLDNPGAVLLPSPFGGGSNSPGAWIKAMWMNRAFDQYVLEDADLETALIEAEQYMADYQTCIDSIPEVEDPAALSQEEGQEFFRQYTDCAITVDPAMSEMFPNIGGGSGGGGGGGD